MGGNRLNGLGGLGVMGNSMSNPELFTEIGHGGLFCLVGSTRVGAKGRTEKE